MKIKKILLSALVIVSTVALAACGTSSSKKASNTDQWDSYVKDGKISMSEERSLSNDYVVLLAKFPLNTFEPHCEFSKFI